MPFQAVLSHSLFYPFLFYKKVRSGNLIAKAKKAKFIKTALEKTKLKEALIKKRKSRRAYKDIAPTWTANRQVIQLSFNDPTICTKSNKHSEYQKAI